jgi:hypothetical protein
MSQSLDECFEQARAQWRFLYQRRVAEIAEVPEILHIPTNPSNPTPSGN